MGMDVNSKAPKNDKGAYFQMSVWGWHPLAHYIQELAPELAVKCKYWHSNDRDGLNAEDSLALAKILRERLATGGVKQDTEAFEQERRETPDEFCKFCEGAGDRPEWVRYKDEAGRVYTLAQVDDFVKDAFDPAKVRDDEVLTRMQAVERFGLKLTRVFENGMERNNGCNACQGTGKVRPAETSYSFDESDVREFAEFLENCGGFEIC